MNIFTTEEIDHIKDAADHIASLIGQSVDFFDLADDWASFVEQVTKGYNLEVEDYINELDGRDLIQQISQRCNGEIAKKISDFVTPSDDKFMAVTSQMNSPWIASESKLSDWWYRTPNIPF